MSVARLLPAIFSSVIWGWPCVLPWAIVEKVPDLEEYSVVVLAASVPDVLVSVNLWHKWKCYTLHRNCLEEANLIVSMKLVGNIVQRLCGW